MVKKRSTARSEGVHELERRLAKAIRCKNEQLASDLYVELGDEYRRLGDLQRAIDTYMNGMQLAHRIDAFENAAFAHRAIAEISVDPDINENKRALEHGRMYLEAANKTEQVHLIQLAYHVLGWLYLQVYLNSATKHTSLLEKGKRWCEKCVAYLEQKAAEIDCDQRAVRMGRDSACRRARVRQVLSQICDKLGMVQLARCHHGAVMAYASRTADFDLQYRCLLAKLDFTGEQRLKTAIELVHVASNLSSRELLEAQLILAQEKARVKDFEGAKWDLISMLSSKGFTKLEADEQKSFHQLLILVYKTIERLKEVKELDEHQQSRVYEKIADEFYEVELREVSLNFYKLMLDHAKSVRERVAASVSVAITAKELSRYEEAYEYFVRVEMLESELNISDLKRAETAICIACTACNVRTLPNSRILDLFARAESCAVTNAQKCDLYEAMLEFLRKSNAEESLIKSTEDKMAKTKSAADEEREIGDGTIEDDFDSDARSSFADRWDEMTDMEIIQRCTVESSRRSVEERINREKDKRINSYGETRLHEAARGDDIVYLKALVAAGYNVNARDEGGWTPLHEAIGAQKLENLRLLLQAGAKTDIRSREGNISAEGQRTDSGGLTPLMEACDRGSTAMIDTLLEFGANVSLKNPDSWTAVDFLRNAITAGMVEEEDMSEAERLIHLMEDKLRKANIRVSNVPPPKKIAEKSEQKSRSLERRPHSSRNEQLSPEECNLREYRRTMCKLGRGSVHEYVSIDEVASTGSAHSTRPEGTAGRVAVLGEDLNALLYGGEETTENCLESLIESGPSRSSLSERSPPERPISLGKPTRQNTDYGANDFVEDDIGEIKRQRGSRTRKRHSSPVALRSSASKMPRHIELPDSSSSDEEILIDSTNSTSHSNFMDAEHTSVPFATGTKTERPSGDAVRLNAATGIIASSSQNTAQSSKPIIRSSSCASTTQQQTSVADRLLFVKVVFMTDAGVRLKTKGIPFPSASRLCDVKARCKSEVEAEGEFQSLSLYDGDCELDDETPLELVAGCNKLVECRVFGWMPPSPAHLYATKSARLMSNIVRALGNALDGRLCVSEENVREDTAFIAALLAFAPRSLSAICIDGNEWSVELVEVIGKMAADLNELSMECCQLNSKGVRLLLETGRSYTQLTKLNMSFNDLSTSNVSDSIASLVHACPNISTLHLACCNLEHSTATQLVDVISECNHLKELDLSQNGSITAEHIARILSSCSKLKRLNVAATGVTEINAKVDVVSELSDINLSLCDLCDDPEALFDWLLKCCHEMASIDLRATNISYAQLETFCKRKGAKQPISTLKLAGCTAIESDVDAFVSLLKLLVTTDFAIKFDLGEEFKSKIIAALPESFVFCIA